MDVQADTQPRQTGSARVAIGVGLLGLVAGGLIGALPVSAEGVACGPAFGTIDQFRDTYACIDAMTSQRNVAIIVLVIAGLALAAGVFLKQSTTPVAVDANRADAVAADAAPAEQPAVSTGGDPEGGGSDKAWIAVLILLVVVVIVIGVST